jgi:hypothetical protein
MVEIDDPALMRQSGEYELEPVNLISAANVSFEIGI